MFEQQTKISDYINIKKETFICDTIHKKLWIDKYWDERYGHNVRFTAYFTKYNEWYKENKVYSKDYEELQKKIREMVSEFDICLGVDYEGDTIELTKLVKLLEYQKGGFHQRHYKKGGSWSLNGPAHYIDDVNEVLSKIIGVRLDRVGRNPNFVC